MFIFFEGLSLGLRLTSINRRKIVELSLISIRMLPIGLVFVFLGQSIALWVPGIDLSYFWGWLETCFYFCIDNFLTTSSHKSKSYLWLSNWTWMNGHNLLWKYHIKVFLLAVAMESNLLKTACKCFKCAAQSRLYSSWYWEFLLILAQ